MPRTARHVLPNLSFGVRTHHPGTAVFTGGVRCCLAELPPCVALPATLAFIACSERRDAGGPAAPAALISDAATTAAHRLLFPAAAGHPGRPSGTFDADIATLAPAIAICDVTDRPDTDCGGASVGATAAVVVFTTTTARRLRSISPPRMYSELGYQGHGIRDGSRLSRARHGRRPSGATRAGSPMCCSRTFRAGGHRRQADLIVMNDGRTIPSTCASRPHPGGLAVSAAMATVRARQHRRHHRQPERSARAPAPGVTVAWSVITTPADGVADPNQPLNPAVGRPTPAASPQPRSERGRPPAWPR